MMKTTRLYLLLTLLLCCLSTSAQRRLIVVDVETLVPVDGANVVGNSLSAQTDTLGYIFVPDSCQSLLFSHVNYESRLINLKEVRDTVFLISKLLNVKEVVVFGKTPHVEEYEELQKRMRLSKTDMQLSSAQPGDGINLLGLFNYLIPKKWKKAKKEKRKERLKRAIEDY
ncbi:MAG: hypothetical protein IJ887_12155 [Prevotella sp.]|nr:hypothetical protein [Prevotella sp.]